MPMPLNYTEPDFTLLERAVAAAGLPAEVCGEFMWMHEDPQGVHHYKHCGTRGYAHLSADLDAAACTRRIVFARTDGTWGREPK